MMLLAGFSDIIDTPAPVNEGDEALNDFVSIYDVRMRDKYKAFLRAASNKGFTEEDHFQMVLEYGRTRNLGGIRQSMDVSIPIPRPETRIGPHDTPTGGWDEAEEVDDLDDDDEEAVA